MTITNQNDISQVAELGVVFLMFMIGLELSFERLRLLRRLVFGLGGAQIRIGFALGTVLGSGSGILAYLVIGWIANAKPSSLYDASPDQQAFWRDVRVAPKRTLRDVNAQFRDADRRLRDLEFHLTSESRELANEIEKLR